MRPPGSPQELEQRRLRALTLLAQGLGPVEVARQLSVERRSVRRWKSVERRLGREALQARLASGRPPKLGKTERKRLVAALLRGAKHAGFETDLWTCPRVARLIEAKFGVRYHVDHVCRLLHWLGFTPQKPVRRAAERDEEAIRQWVQREWPVIKKKRAS